MQDMAHFMGQDAADFIFVEKIQNSGSCRNGGMGGASTRSKGIGYLRRDDVNFRHGQFRPLSQVGNDTVQVMVFPNFLRPIGFKDHGITEPVGNEVHARSDEEHDHAAAAAADKAADGHEDTGQGRHEEYRFYAIHKINSLSRS